MGNASQNHGSSWVSTGHLPDPAIVQALIREAHQRFGTIGDGRVADYIPALASANPDSFAIAVADTNGDLFAVGDASQPFSIQSLSKPFMFALVCQAIGEQDARLKLGVNSTGLPFNSVLAAERSVEGLSNPMVNAGAIAATSLAPGSTAEAKWAFISEGFSRFAGRELQIDAEVYASEAASNQRNSGIASLLGSHERIYFDPEAATDLYTRQCSLAVTSGDLAVMAATMANGGRNPLSGEQVIEAIHCQHVLAVMVTAGLYENSGDWLYAIGLPGKSGVAGGMITVAPGKGGLATYSPPLDEAGNSVRGQLTARFLSEQLGLNLFASRPGCSS
ncbi:glutaminase A [Synechococcus sp. CS-1324]|uniref:glutaminase A n=1 Tax=unclassified Synechococcus TaxID=2626047 RepID=UPI000DB0AC6B|nr:MULTISPECIES: glutaminase A [unclassified Synechococcus]MCT0211963.1 glutaminase A [Synechococcus sp. CS-1326]MCT0229710.1 glutaminase A [Synechococcus sp. CS-1324]MCT0232375.1 glutaminase A [Synechococcus sp. CS-1327]PZV04319.1 MAG: glutaminase [Cyanobium sp.]